MLSSTKVTMKFSLLLSASIAAAAPLFAVDAPTNRTSHEVSFAWDPVWNQDYELHRSCNASQVTQLNQAFTETKLLAQHAKEHTLRYGNSSEFYRRYFGNAPTGEVVGIYENVISSNKTGVLFRCDNIDGNCNLTGWAGHWRGENGSDETVICDLSYTSRLFLSQVCSRGYTVSGSKDNTYWASDLLHRIWHTVKIGQDVVGHYADTFKECLELAHEDESLAVRNSASLRYFALDVYAYDIAVPGIGCTGKIPELSSNGNASGSESASAGASATATATGSDSHGDSHGSGSECHTHANGETHCV